MWRRPCAEAAGKEWNLERCDLEDTIEHLKGAPEGLKELALAAVRKTLAPALRDAALTRGHIETVGNIVAGLGLDKEFRGKVGRCESKLITINCI